MTRLAPSLRQALASAQQGGLDRLDSQLLLLHALGKPHGQRAWLLAHDDELLTDAAAETFDAFCKRRASGEPVAYIVGRKEFFGLSLQVDARVLVPRPDTETLVQWLLDVLIDLDNPTPRVLDLGTGSGAIALALAWQLKRTGRVSPQMTAVDASADALAIAAANAAELGVAESVNFVQSNWLDKLSSGFDLIASNPPYIASGDEHLRALKHEPLEALASGEDGLDDLRRIISQAPAYLETNGWLLLEHGHDQAERVRELLAQRGFSAVQSRRDLAGHARCSGGQWPGEMAG